MYRHFKNNNEGRKAPHAPFYLLIAFLLLSLSSCSSLLDVEPTDTLPTQEAFQTPDDLRSALTGVYYLVKGEDLAGRNWLFFSDLMSGNANFSSEDFSEFDNLMVSPYNERVAALWTTSYRAINQLNQILRSIDPVAQEYAGFSMAEQEQLHGEALFLRGVIYFQLVQYFALPWAEETKDSLGVPLALTPVLEKGALTYPARSSIDLVYERVWADLTLAQEKLSETAPSGKPVNLSATAFLARVAFRQNRYTEADVLAERVLEGPFALTDTPQEFFREEGSSEEIWVAAAGADNPNYAGLNWAYSEASVSPELIQHGYENLLLPSQQQALAQAGYQAIDLRGNADWITDDPLLSSDSTRSLKYEDGALGDDAPLLRLAEFYLIRAECAARSDKLEEALDWLNVVRRRAFRIVDEAGDPVPNGEAFIEYDAQDLSKEELLEAIAIERRVELAFEGDYLFDLLRRRADVQGLAWNVPRLRLPIPQREIDVNPNLEQNPGY